MAKLLETDLATRVYRVASGVNDALYIAANEPSLGMYRIQEHVSLTVPKVVEQRQYLQEVCQQVGLFRILLLFGLTVTCDLYSG